MNYSQPIFTFRVSQLKRDLASIAWIPFSATNLYYWQPEPFKLEHPSILINCSILQKNWICNIKTACFMLKFCKKCFRKWKFWISHHSQLNSKVNKLRQRISFQFSWFQKSHDKRWITLSCCGHFEFNWEWWEIQNFHLLKHFLQKFNIKHAVFILHIQFFCKILQFIKKEGCSNLNGYGSQ